MNKKLEKEFTAAVNNINTKKENGFHQQIVCQLEILRTLFEIRSLLEEKKTKS